MLTGPNWLYEHLERWHYLSFLKTRKNLDLLRRIHFEAIEPERTAALIALVENHLGYRLYQAIEDTKCALSNKVISEFRFEATPTKISDRVRREDFERWINTELQQIEQGIDRLLRNCNIGPQDIDAIFMTGGTSFVPAIRRLFALKFGPEVPSEPGRNSTRLHGGWRSMLWRRRLDHIAAVMARTH